jgi:hypothetical protein
MKRLYISRTFAPVQNRTPIAGSDCRHAAVALSTTLLLVPDETADPPSQDQIPERYQLLTVEIAVWSER